MVKNSKTGKSWVSWLEEMKKWVLDLINMLNK